MKLFYLKIKRNLYIITPLITLLSWAFIALFKDNFNLLDSVDFPAYYYAGKFIFTNPELVYFNKFPSRYYYLPSFAIIFSILSLLDYGLSQWIYFVIILIFAVLSIIEFNKILILRKIDSKFTRFLFLMIISNGLVIMQIFDYLQTKFIVLFLILLFLKREIEKEQYKINDNLKFVFIQLMILVFAIGMIPHFIFLVLIYLLNNVNIKSILNNAQIKKFTLFFIVFFIQNFIFFVFPVLIFEFLRGSSFGVSGQCGLYVFFYFFNNHFLFMIISIISLTIMSFIISFKKNLGIEKKFGYFTFVSLFLNVYINQTVFGFLLPLILLLFIFEIHNLENYWKAKSYLIFVKKNYIFLIGLIIIVILYFIHPLEFYYRFFPVLILIPTLILMLRWIFLYSFLLIDLYLLKIKQKYSS